jgi:glutaconate CoA-transferase subunit B
VILFREEHTRRVMVPQVEFVSAAGPKNDGTYRPGGPIGMLTNLCWFSFDKKSLRFKLESVHPGRTVEEVRDNTGFDFDCPVNVPQTAMPDAATLALVRSRIAGELADAYPRFVTQVFGQAA